MDSLPVKMARFGKDHWSTFAYVETRIVDHHGTLHADHMRTHPKLHLRAYQMKFHPADGSPYATRLRGAETVKPHDDWSCVEDMIAEGLLEMAPHTHREGARRDGWSSSQRMGFVCDMCDPTTGNCHMTFRLTAFGHEIASQLRAHKGTGGNFAGFKPALRRAKARVAAVARSERGQPERELVHAG